MQCSHLPDLDMSVFYGVGVAFDQLFHLSQVRLLDVLKCLLNQTHTQSQGQICYHMKSYKLYPCFTLRLH